MCNGNVCDETFAQLCNVRAPTICQDGRVNGTFVRRCRPSAPLQTRTNRCTMCAPQSPSEAAANNSRIEWFCVRCCAMPRDESKSKCGLLWCVGERRGSRVHQFHQSCVPDICMNAHHCSIVNRREEPLARYQSTTLRKKSQLRRKRKKHTHPLTGAINWKIVPSGIVI